jgi:hypothetical protein
MDDLSNITTSKALSQIEIFDLNVMGDELLHCSGLCAWLQDARKTCGALHI